jgi:hypothetical protein
MKKFISAGIVLVGMPFIAFAADAGSIINVISGILGYIIPVLISLAVVYFVWGVIQYTVSTDEEAKKKAKSGIIQGLIGLFIILSFWGIVRVIQNTFGVSGVKLNTTDIPSSPTFDNNGNIIIR